jgi:crotonobetainyl-CoA:carnitine CoA-transferase CaiB-like acyl-CoA transferase
MPAPRPAPPFAPALPAAEFTPAAQGPLAGLCVLDLSRLVAGNVLSWWLADFGAEVIKVEDPERGDPLRAWQQQGVSFFWKVFGRNKRSLALDLKSEEGRALIGRLAAKSAVLIENFRPGTLEAMGLAPERLWAANPSLVIARVSGFGQDGPYRRRPGFGTLVEAMSGFAAKCGFPDREPLLPPLALADMIAGLAGAFATLAALRTAEATGRGQVIDIALLEAIHTLLGPDTAIFAALGEKPARTGNRSLTSAPRGVFRTRDGRYVALSASMQTMAERLFRAIGRPEMITDPRFRTNSDRLAHVEACEAPIAAFIAARDLDEVLALFEAAEVTVAPVYEVDQFVADPQVTARGTVLALPDAELGRIALPAVTPRLSATPGALRHPAPALGADTRALLTELGLGAAEIEALAARGLIRLGEEEGEEKDGKEETEEP